MEFLEAVGSRRSIRWFKTWEKVPRESIQRILEVARLTTCPGNLQPWRAIVVERDEIDESTRDGLLGADNWQGAHTQARYGSTGTPTPRARGRSRSRSAPS